MKTTFRVQIEHHDDDTTKCFVDLPLKVEIRAKNPKRAIRKLAKMMDCIVLQPRYEEPKPSKRQ